jgi:predicted acyltransferase
MTDEQWSERPMSPEPAAPVEPLEAGPTNGSAVASLVLGIVGLTGFPVIPSILALVFGYRARREITQAPGTQSGLGLAKAGIVLGWIGVILIGLVIMFFIWVLAIPVGFSVSETRNL